MLLGAATRRPQPMFDLASSAADMKARVAGIPVYTVANKADEFVLVTGGEVKDFITCGHIMLPVTVHSRLQHWAVQEGDKKQLGLFFFVESDAKALVEKVMQAWQLAHRDFYCSSYCSLLNTIALIQIHEQNPKLGKDSKVLEVGLDQVYNFSSGSLNKGTDGLCFRFMPDAQEIQQALQVFTLPPQERNPCFASTTEFLLLYQTQLY